MLPPAMPSSRQNYVHANGVGRVERLNNPPIPAAWTLPLPSKTAGLAVSRDCPGNESRKVTISLLVTSVSGRGLLHQTGGPGRTFAVSCRRLGRSSCDNPESGLAMGRPRRSCFTPVVYPRPPLPRQLADPACQKGAFDTARLKRQPRPTIRPPNVEAKTSSVHTRSGRRNGVHHFLLLACLGGQNGRNEAGNQPCLAGGQTPLPLPKTNESNRDPSNPI